MVKWLLDIVKDNSRCRRRAVNFWLQLTSCVSVGSPLTVSWGGMGCTCAGAVQTPAHAHTHKCTHTCTHTYIHAHVPTHMHTHHSVHTYVHIYCRRVWHWLQANTATVSSWTLSPAPPQLRDALFWVTDGVVRTGSSSGSFGKKPVKNRFNNTILHQWN